MARVVFVCGIDKLIGRECCTAFLALVAVCSLSAASWTCAYDISVGKELAGHFVAVLKFGYLLQFALVIKRAEEVCCKLMVNV